MTTLPNPFSFADSTPCAAEAAAASIALSPLSDAAAGLFVLDERTFMEALEEPPLFLRPGFATDLIPVLAVLAGH
jgi:hypothetical protein